MMNDDRLRHRREALAVLIAGPPPPPGTDTWFCRDLGRRSREQLRAERARLRMAAFLTDGKPTHWWLSARLQAIEQILADA